MDGIIHLLSEETIDQIAAGEVIENPASVVKELIENAVDAGSTRVVIEILGGGFQSIIISDDGSGMSDGDALLCLKRHATSKIRRSEDLVHLHTMGFRGEALASIAAISKLTLTTAMQDKMGMTLSVEGGSVMFTEPSARSPGTCIEVQSLFYNVPARRKFQKTASASSAEITRVITLLALAHPAVGFELIQQRKTIFSVGSCKNEIELTSLLQKRSADLLGENFQSSMHIIHLKEQECEIHALIGDPCQNRYNRSGQYLFVNSRPVSCLPLSFAIRDGYGTRLDADRHPIYVIHVHIAPSLIDVNVHPQKKEIRLREEGVLKQKMRSAVSLALQRAHMDSAIRIEVPSFALWDKDSSHPLGNDNPMPDKEIAQLQFGAKSLSFEEGIVPSQSIYFKSIQPPFDLMQEAKAIGLFEHYLILEAKSIFAILSLDQEKADGVVWIDLRAAQARILYERLLCENAYTEGQGLLIPMTFSCSKAESQHISGHLDVLHQLGFQLRSIGPTVFMVDVIPSCLKEADVHNVFHELLAEWMESPNALLSLEKKLRQCTAAICRLSSSRKKVFSVQEALGIFKELVKMRDFFQCPRGRPIFHHIKKDEIEHYFTQRK